MRLGFIAGTNTLDYDPACARAFYEAHEAFRESISASATAAGVSVDSLLSPVPEGVVQQELFGETGRRLAAVVLGINDVLTQLGLVPAAVGGLSLGSLIMSCAAGGIDRHSLFGVIEANRRAPGPAEHDPPEATAIAVVASGDRLLEEDGRPDGIYVGGDLGRSAHEGRLRLIMLSGHRRALEELAAAAPEGTVTVMPHSSVAVHTPLRASARDYVAPTLARIRFTDPTVALCSGLESRTVTTADGVRELFARNLVDRFDLTAVLDQMARHDVGLLMVLGPTLPEGFVDFPVPVLHVDAPEQVADAVGMAIDLGIQLGAPVPGLTSLGVTR
ncbi:MAG TPA: hypothetical protein VH141_16625 [Pseudonocardia sp.]|nr:hypothetical protein [Pseudonocardia sp.]